MSTEHDQVRATVGDTVRPVPATHGRLAHLRREAQRAERRLIDHPEIDGEGIRLALEHEWAVMDLAQAASHSQERARVR